MFIGASPASTGGGVKTTTVAALFLLVAATIRGREDVNVFGKRLSTSTVRRALTVLFIGLTSNCVSTVFSFPARLYRELAAVPGDAS